MVVYGINDHLLSPETAIFSCASCTTHSAAPLISVLDELCGIQQAYITTVHSYTSDQSLHDRPHRDLRRARAAGQSIVPTTTGAAKAPGLKFWRGTAPVFVLRPTPRPRRPRRRRRRGRRRWGPRTSLLPRRDLSCWTMLLGMRLSKLEPV